MRVVNRLHMAGLDSLTSEGSLEAGSGLESKNSNCPKTNIHSREDMGQSRESRRTTFAENDGIMVSKAIEQEVEFREGRFDDRCTKDLTARHD